MTSPPETLFSIFRAFLKLGFTSFGGPIAHIGYLRHEFVERRGWLEDEEYADLVALCQFLPGPASSQVGMALGAARAGWPGALAAWVGFTAPSAVIMILFGYGVVASEQAQSAGWLHGLKLAAVAVVAQAVWSMGRQLCPDRARVTLALAAAAVSLLLPGATLQLAIIGAGALIGRAWLPGAVPEMTGTLKLRLSKSGAVASWIVFLLLFVLLPVAVSVTGNHALALFDAFYRTGSLVFGGGHVVLPLLRSEVVPPGWVSDTSFLAGYGMAQAIPGPLFTFAAYLGTVDRLAANGWSGALLALTGIFLPALLLVMGALPFWDTWRKRSGIRAALNGVNASVVGILLSALYNPIFTGSVTSNADFALVMVAFGFLVWWKWPPLWIVLGCAGGGAIMQFL